MLASPSPHVRTPLADSPWFWALLFGWAALLALIVIGPKFNRRQARLERMYHARQAAQLRGGNGESIRPEASSEASDPAESADHDGRQVPERIVPLDPLLGVLATMMFAVTAAFLFSRRRARSLTIQVPRS